MPNENLPVIILNQTAIFPSFDIRIDFKKEEDKKIIELAENYYKNELILALKEDPLEENPEFSELLKVGIHAEILSTLELPNHSLRVTFHAHRRIGIKKFYQEEEFIYAKIKKLLMEEINIQEELVYLQALKNMITGNLDTTSEFLAKEIGHINDLNLLTDIIACSFPFREERQKEYLLEINQLKRAQMLLGDLREIFQVQEIEKNLDEKTEERISEEQKRYFLREKIKVIKEELGENYDMEEDIFQLKEKLENLKCNTVIRAKIEREIHKLEGRSIQDPESGVLRNYIELMLSLPWEEETIDEKDFKKIEEVLNKNHYGLTEIKERILEYIALREKTGNSIGSILCLVGPPGVGKTTLAKSIAESLNKKLAKISVGGIQDEADIVGHRRTYIGAMPGMIIEGIRKSGVRNPLFIIDEIDKMTKSIQKDPASSLLEALDKEQNAHFVDHYVEEPFDLSKVLFITTANYIEQIPLELLDRLEVIELSSYTEFEKLEILKQHIIPKTIRDYHLEEEKIEFKEDSLLYMIRYYTKEAGVREIERLIQKILRKYVKESMHKKSKKLMVTKKNLSYYLGKEIYSALKPKEKSVIGVVNGLSYTPYGGDTLKIEASMYPGTGKLILTGSLGEVMKESADVCLSYIKANASYFHIQHEIFLENDFHIHAEEGAIKKEGPSAGVSLTTVLLSILTHTKVDIDVAMTGEMTLRGTILPIGGVREKVIGAEKEGITKVFLPEANRRDLDSVPEEVKNKLTFFFCTKYEDIYQELFFSKSSEEDIIELIQLEL